MQLPPPPPPPGDLPPPPPPSWTPVPAWQNPALVAAPPPNYLQAAGVAYAGFWIRFTAYFVDSLIVGVANFVVSFVLGLLIGVLVLSSGRDLNDTSSSVTLNLISALVGLSISVGYFTFYWAGGQTLAMRWFGLRVVDATYGGPIGVSRGLLRWVGLLLSTLACYVGLIWAAFDPRKQGWHDKIANTVVIRV